MLYVTTRDDLITYTSEQALFERRAPDGGFYIPYRIPKLTSVEIRALKEMDSAEKFSFIVRRFLRVPEHILTEHGVPVRLNYLGNRVTVARIFPKSFGSFRDFTEKVSRSIYSGGRADGLWLSMAMRIGAIAVAVSEYGPMEASCRRNTVDISVVSGDLFGPLSAYLARKMGLPVGSILCCCNENSGFWELLHHGTFRTGLLAVRTNIPEADHAIPDGLECLIASCCGREEVMRYLGSVRSGRPYTPGEEELARLRYVFRAAVVTGSGILRGANITGCTSCKPSTALALTGLLDYRSAKGCAGPALVIAE